MMMSVLYIFVLSSVCLMMEVKDIRSNVRISAGSPYVSWVLLYTRCVHVHCDNVKEKCYYWSAFVEFELTYIVRKMSLEIIYINDHLRY